jgi:hypothetical protein
LGYRSCKEAVTVSTCASILGHSIPHGVIASASPPVSRSHSPCSSRCQHGTCRTPQRPRHPDLVTRRPAAPLVLDLTGEVVGYRCYCALRCFVDGNVGPARSAELILRRRLEGGKRRNSCRIAALREPRGVVLGFECTRRGLELIVHYVDLDAYVGFARTCQRAVG